MSATWRAAEVPAEKDDLLPGINDRITVAGRRIVSHIPNVRSRVGAEATAQLAWILGPRLPEPEGGAEADS